jgi:MFS family permease
MIPFMIGFVVSGPISGKLSDRYGARPFTTAGMLLSGAMYAVMMTFPANFSYLPFATVMFVSGIGGGLFASPNTASIMNSVPARHRGAASGMRVTFAQSGMPLSMGLFFTLLVVGLNSKVPSAMYHGLLAHGVPAASAAQLSHLPPLGYIFAAFLGLNPLKSLLGPTVLSHLAPGQAAAITGRSFFPHLIGPPFKDALLLILAFAVVMSVIAAIASALRGEKFIHVDEESIAQRAGLHHAHGLRIRHGGDGRAAPRPLGGAVEGAGAADREGAVDRDGATSSPGELLGSGLPGPGAPATRE